MIVGNTKSGRWNNDNWSDYNVTKINDLTSVKDYVVSSKTYEGQTIAGKYKANDGFGEKEVLVPATNSTGTKDRFYIMSLENFIIDDFDTFYWYYSGAAGKLDDPIETSSEDFGEGYTKTGKEIDRWKKKIYGDQNERDLWGVIQEKYAKGWFIPSKGEWSAFGEELGITKENYENKRLSNLYWASSQRNVTGAYLIDFTSGYMQCYNVDSIYPVRMSTTF